MVGLYRAGLNIFGFPGWAWDGGWEKGGGGWGSICLFGGKNPLCEKKNIWIRNSLVKFFDLIICPVLVDSNPEVHIKKVAHFYCDLICIVVRLRFIKVCEKTTGRWQPAATAAAMFC